MAIEVSRAARVTDGPSRHRVIGSGGAAYWLSAALGVAAAASSLLTFAVPSLLRGTAVMNGSARGTALPASPVASGALVPAFATLAVIGLIPACLLLHGLSGGVPGVTAAPRSPAAARYGWHPWALAGLDGLTGAAVQMLILRRYFFLQPVIAGIGAVEVLLAWRWQRSGRIVTGSRDQRP